MYHTEASVYIDKPVPNVFAIVSDMNLHQKWQDGLIESKWTSPTPVGVGSTYVFVSQFAGTRWDIPGSITEWNPPQGLQWKANDGPFPVQGGFRLEPVSKGTRIIMFSDSEPKGWMNVMRPLLKWMGERIYRSSLTRLKMMLESEQTKLNS
jgi:uncharacterized protein YndB with AHSA1/START domain